MKVTIQSNICSQTATDFTNIPSVAFGGVRKIIVSRGMLIAERLSARHPNSASRSRFVMFVCMYVCQSRFRNSIIVTLRNSGRSVEESARAYTTDNVCDPMNWSW